jgi:hypothetical protein
MPVVRRLSKRRGESRKRQVIEFDHSGLETAQKCVISKPVNPWKAILSLALVAIWLPATSHCKLERLPGFQFLECASDCPTSSDCATDGCELEDSFYKTPDNVPLVAPAGLVLAVVSSLSPNEDLPSLAFGVGFGSAAPPELPQNWRFHRRAAGLPRAPSFAS